ncbi:hypothetical protein [Burkholderia ambifaria]|uniref:hypothetical protein n=1 Tax=Burkholderia ambifaria TaxID=152480 RepID=UPI001B8E41E2|nr:hypothetical protein [Burkholderia ambifaria]MBR8257336.1 hypothetical protein [Burkholderia ambifaria]
MSTAPQLQQVRREMKKITFAIAFLCFSYLSFVLIPNRWIETFVFNHLHVNGDGEEAMNNFYLLALAIKLLVSALVSFAILSAVGSVLTKQK